MLVLYDRPSMLKLQFLRILQYLHGTPALRNIRVQNSSWLAATSSKAEPAGLLPYLSLHVLDTSVHSALLISL